MKKNLKNLEVYPTGLWSPCDWCSKNSVFHVFSQTWIVRIVKTFKQSMLYNVIKYYIATNLYLVLTSCVQTQYTTPSMFCQRDLSLPCSHIDLNHLKEYCSICCTFLLLNSTLMLFPHWCSSPTQAVSFYHTAWWEWDRVRQMSCQQAFWVQSSYFGNHAKLLLSGSAFDLHIFAFQNWKDHNKVFCLMGEEMLHGRAYMSRIPRELSLRTPCPYSHWLYL